METGRQVQQEVVNSFILLDDDEIVHFFNNKLISSLVSNSKITSFTSGFEVLRHLKSNPDEIRIIIIDLDMPIMSGWDFLNALRSENYDQPVYILSSSDASKEQGRMSSYGFVRGYFLKPLNSNDIRKILETSKNGFTRPTLNTVSIL